MGFLECLIFRNVFRTIEVGFLLIFHTHNSIDQTFSTTSRWLHTENEITLDYLHGVLLKR